MRYASNISSGNGSENSARSSSRVQSFRTWPRPALEKGSACVRDIGGSSTTIAIAGRMPICNLAEPAGHAAHADAFSIDAQFEIRGYYGAAKLRHQALIEVKPNRRIQV